MVHADDLMWCCSQPLKDAEVKSLEKALKGFMKESKVLKLEKKVGTVPLVAPSVYLCVCVCVRVCVTCACVSPHLRYLA